MHCRTCGYLLFNLTVPQCPECSTPFDLRTYRFKHGTVAFACPLCGSRHAGQGDRYIPSQADTVRCQGCGEEIETTTMAVVPLGDPDSAVVASHVPWEHRELIGFWRAYWQTLKSSLIEPNRMGEALSIETSARGAHGFAVLTNVVSVLPLAALLLISVTIKLVNPSGAPPQGAGALMAPVLAIAMAALTPLIAVAIIALPAHAVIRLGGGTSQPMGVTITAVLYGLGPMIVNTVFGFFCAAVGVIWSLIGIGCMLAWAHNLSGGRAALAVLAGPTTILLTCVGGSILLIALAA